MKISKTPASLLLSFSAYLAFSSGLLALDNLSGTVTSADALSYEDVIVSGDLNLTGNGILFNGDISSSGPSPELNLDAGSGTVVFNNGDYMSFSTIRVLSDSNISGLFRAQTVDLQGDVSLTGNLKVEAGEIRPNLNLTEAPVFTYDFVEQNGSSNGSYMGRGRGAYLSPDLDKLLFNSEYFGTRIFDFSDPTNPVLFGGDDNITVFYDPLENNTTRLYYSNFSKDGNEVFVVHLNGYFASYDISDPTNPVFLDDLNFSELIDTYMSPNLYEFDLSNDGNLAALVDNSNRIFIIDVNDSSNLSVQSSLDLNITDPAANLVTWQGIQFSNNDQYVIAGTSFKYSASDIDHNITIYDTSSASLNKVSSIEIGSNFDNGGGIWETVLSKDGNTIYAGGFGSVVAVDVSDPNNPSKLWERTTYDYHGTNVSINTYGMNVSADGKTLFLSDWTNKTVLAYDISDPSNPVELGSIPLDSVSGINDSPNFNRMTSTPDGKYIIPSTYTWDENDPPTAMAIFEVPYELLGDGNLTIGGKIDGAFDLSTNDFNGSLIFRDSIGSQTPLASINIENNKSTLFDFSGSVTTTGDQNYSGLVTSTGSMDFNGGGAGSFQDINMGGNNLDLNFSNGVSINGSFAEIDHLSVLGDLTLTDGFNGGLNSISVDGTSTLAGDFTTDGNQSYGTIYITSPYGEVTSFATGTGTLYAGNIYGSGRDVSLGDSNQTGSIYLNALQSNSLTTAASNYDLTIGSSVVPTLPMGNTVFNNTGTLTFGDPSETSGGAYYTFWNGITATEPSEVIVAQGGVYTFGKDMNMSNVTISASGNSHFNYVRFDTTWTQYSGVAADGANITINGFREDDSFNASYLEFNLGSGTENIGRFTGDINMSTDTLRYLSGNGAFEFDGNLTLAGEITPPPPYHPITREIRNGFSTNFNADVNLSGATEIQLPNSVTFANGINAHGNDLTLDLNGTTFDLSQLSNVNNFTLETNASVSGAFVSGGFQKYNDSLSLLNDSSLSGTELNASSILGGGFDLDLNFSETASLYNISNIKDLHSLGNVSAGGTIQTSQSQTYDGTVSLVDDSNFTGTNFVSSGTIAGGGFDLTLDFAESNISLANVSNVANLLVESNASTNGNLSTTGSQTYNGSFSLLGDSNLSGTTLVMASAIQGDGNGLDLNFSDTITMSGATGLTSISVDGNLTAEGLISSTGAQSFEDKITLSDDLNLTSGSGNIDIRNGISGSSNSLYLGNSSQTGTIALTGDIALGALDVQSGDYNVSIIQNHGETVTFGGSTNFLNTGTLTLTTGYSEGNFIEFTDELNASAPTQINLFGKLTSNGDITLTNVFLPDGVYAYPLGYLETNNSSITIKSIDFNGGAFAFDAGTTGDLTILEDSNLSGLIFVGSSNLLAQGNVSLGGQVTFSPTNIPQGPNFNFDGNVTLESDTQIGSDTSESTMGSALFANGIEANNYDLTLRLINDHNLSDFRNVKNFLSEGNITALGDFSTSGSQTYNGKLTIGNDLTLSGTSISASNIAGGGNDLDLNFSTTTDLRGISGVADLNVTGDATTGGVISTTGSQTYGGTFGLTADSSLSGTTLSVNDIAGGGYDLDLNFSSAVTLGTISNVADFLSEGNVSIGGTIAASGSQTYNGTVSLYADSNLSGTTLDLVGSLNGANNDLVLDFSEDDLALSNITSVANLTVESNATTNSGISSSGVQTYNGKLTLGGDSNFSGTSFSAANLAGGGFDLDLNFSASTNLSGMNGVDNLTSHGPTSLNGTLSTSGSQTYNGTLVLSGDSNLSGSTFTSAGGIDANNNDLVLDFSQDDVSLSTLSNLASLTIESNATTSSGISSSGAQAYNGKLTLGADSNFSGTNFSAANLSGGGYNLGLNFSGNSNLGGVSNVQNLLSEGNLTAGGVISTLGSQTYNGALVLSADSNFSGTILSANNVSGNGYDLDLNFSGVSSLAGMSGVDNFSSEGSVSTGGTIATSGSQSYNGGLTLSSDSSLSGTTLSSAAIDGGGNNLDLNFSGSTTLSGITNLGNFSSEGDILTSGAFTTNGSQTFNGALTLGGDANFTGSSFSAVNLTGGGFDLDLNFSGTTGLSGVSGVKNITVHGASNLNGTLTTSGSQTFNNTLSLLGDSTLSGTTLSTTSIIGGGNDLTIDFDQDDVSLSAISGVDNFTAESNVSLGGSFVTNGAQTYNGKLTLTADSSLIGSDLTASNIQGGGFDLDLNISNGLSLSGISDVKNLTAATGVVLGGTFESNGSQEYTGGLTLSSDTTLSGTTFSADNVIGGGNDLDLNFSGVSTLSGAANVKDLTVHGSLSASGSLATTGSQTFNETLSLSGDLNLTSGSGTITIDSGVSGSSADLKLGDGAQTGSVALSEGGTLDSLAIGNGSFDLTLGLTDQNLTIANRVIFENSGTVRFTTAEHSGLSLGEVPNFQFNGGLDANSTDLVILENSLISTSQDSISLNRVKVVSTDDDSYQENSYLSTFDVSDISEEITEISGNNIAIQDLNVTDAVLVALPGSSNLLTVGNLLINDGVLYLATGDLNVTGNSLIHGQINNFLNPEVMSDQYFEGDVTLTGSSTFVAQNGYFTNGIDAQNNDLTINFGNDHNLSEFRNAANFTAGMSGFENGIIYANGDFETNGSQTYNANLVLSANSSLSGTNITTANSIDGGGNDLHLNFSGTSSLAGFSNLQNFSSQGTVNIEGTFETNGTQTYTGSASLSADTNLSSNETVNFVAGLDLSGNALVLDAPSISGAIVNSGSLSFNSSADANVSSTISGSGSVTKSGDSTLTLSGTSSYAGSTTVEDGTLEVSGSINQSTVTIEDGASLAGSGSTGSVIVKNGGTISPANTDSGGTLSVTGDVTLHAGGNYFFEVIGDPEGVAGTDWDTVSASGNVVIDSSESSPFHVHASKVAGNSFDPSAKKYIWELISYGGNITGFNRKSFDVNASGMGSFEGRFYVDQEEDLNALILIYKTASVFVTSEGVWSTTNVWEGESIIEDSDSLEFTGPGGTSVNDGFVTLIDDILFTDETTGSYVVSGTGFSLSENGIVNESAHAQEISMDINLTNDQVIDAQQAALSLSGNIGGTGGIIKRGEHSLTLTGRNSYGGGLIIEKGEVKTTTQSVIGNVANAGTLTFDQNFTGTYSEVVSGIGNLFKDGSGQVRLSGANTYSGGTTVRQGDLAVNHAQALGTGKVTLDGGNLLVYSAQEMNGSIAITGNFDWNSGNIAYFDTGTSPESEDLLMQVNGNLNNGGSGGNFDFSQVEALDEGNYSLVNYTGSTNFSEANFTASHGVGTTLLASFTLEDNVVKLIVTGAESSGDNIQNNGGANTPIVSDYKISKVGVITINKENIVKSLVFENSGTLDIEDAGVLYLSAGLLEADEQNASSEINGGKLVVGVVGEAPVDLIKSGLGKLKVGSDVEVTGRAIVEDGLLTLNGNVSTVDSFVVESTGILGGDGNITTPLLAVSGRLAPGNSPGTLNVTGDIDFNSSSFLEIEIENETNFDRLNASGTVNVDGTVVATPWNDGNISSGNLYDIISASSITGEFSDHQAPDGLRIRFIKRDMNESLFQTGSLLFAPETYTQFALTPNQRSVAAALDTYQSTSFSIGGLETDTNTVSFALDLLPESAYPAAFEQIMPSFYQNLGKSLLNNGYYQSQSVLNRLSAFRKDNGFEQGLKNKKLWRYWTKYNSSSFNSNVIGENSFFDNEIDSYSLGADYLVDHSLTVGFFANRDINDPSYSNGSRMEDQTTSFGIYSSYADEQGYYFESIAHYGLSDLDTTRTISFSNISRTARSSSTANQFGLGVNFGRDFSSGNFVFGPTASLSFTKLTLDNVVEQGADSLNLKIDKHSIRSLRSTLGARIAYNITTKDFVRIVPEARFSFMHDMRDSQKSMTTYLNGGSGAQFNYVTPALDQDSYLTVLGVSALTKKNLSLSAFYNMNSNDTGYESDSLSISVGYSF